MFSFLVSSFQFLVIDSCFSFQFCQFDIIRSLCFFSFYPLFLRSASVQFPSIIRLSFVRPLYLLRSYFNLSTYFLHCFPIVSPSKRWTIDGQSMDNQWTISEGETKDERRQNEGRTKQGRRKNGELAKDERWISDSAVKSFCSCSTRSVCCKKLIRRLVRISLRMQNKNNDASYLHRQINDILTQIYKKSGRLLTYSSFFLLLL